MVSQQGSTMDGARGMGVRSGLPARTKVAALTIGVVAAVGIFAASQKASTTTNTKVSSTSTSSPSASNG